MWRQLTSMRTALILLLLLALAAVPGSVVPQDRVDAIRVGQWKNANPTLAPIYEKLGLFSVYNSVWFSAIYILLMVSLVGCFVPRIRIYWRALRTRPPRAPKNLAVLPEFRSFETDEPAEIVLDRAGGVLHGRRYRVNMDDREDGATVGSVAAQRGYLREAGNLLFHVSVVVVLVGFAIGSLYGFRGAVIVVKGQGFSNSLSQYDDFVPGSFFDSDDLAPFNLAIDDFNIDYQRNGPNLGMPLDFTADLTYQEAPGESARNYALKVNKPLQVDDNSVFLVGNGYAPYVTVRDGEGNVAYSGPTIFLPQDATFLSFGVVKVPDALPEQLALEGSFAPTYGFTMERGMFSAFPDVTDPRLSLLAYRGDLGLDDGAPQSVYGLEKDELKRFKTEDGRDFRLDLSLGETIKLPENAGSVTFDRVERFVRLQISKTPGMGVALGGVVIGLLGVLCSLFVRPRRAWVRASENDGRTLVELAGLDRSSNDDLGDEMDLLARSLREPAAPGSEPQEREQS